MSSMIHGIRILKKEGCTLTFKTYLIYSDWSSLPKTHGFGLAVLMDDGKFEDFQEEFQEKNFIDDNYELAQRYVKKLEISEIKNFPIVPEFREHTWHYLDDNTKQFHQQDILPQATYTLEVIDEKWIDHLKVGNVWETTACDFHGPSWYLEHKTEKSEKFYHIYQDEYGNWFIHYGKIGTFGKKQQLQHTNFIWAEYKVQEKLRKSKGYELVYKNFDVEEFKFEEKLIQEAENKSEQKNTPENSKALFAAIEKKNIDVIHTLLKNGLSVNECKDDLGYYALESVCNAWNMTTFHIELIELLLKYGANPNLGKFGPFFPSLCYTGDEENVEKVIKLLMEYGVDITLIDGTEKHSCLEYAARSGMFWLVKEAANRGVDPFHRSKYGYSPLHYAASSSQNSIEIIDFLLNKGLDIHECVGNWGMPIHWVNKKETLLHLIKKGADVNSMAKNGKTPLHQAISSGKVEHVKILLEHGGDIFLPNEEGLFHTQIAIQNIFKGINQMPQLALEMIKFLVKERNLPLHPDQKSETISILLNKAKSKNKITKVEEQILCELLELGLNPYDTSKLSLLHFAAKINNTTLLQKCLKSEFANVNHQDEYGWTALHYAIGYFDKECANLLLKAGADQKIVSRKMRKYLKNKFPKGTSVKNVEKSLAPK